MLSLQLLVKEITMPRYSFNLLCYLIVKLLYYLATLSSEAQIKMVDFETVCGETTMHADAAVFVNFLNVQINH